LLKMYAIRFFVLADGRHLDRPNSTQLRCLADHRAELVKTD
jgi:hypothetical protein